MFRRRARAAPPDVLPEHLGGEQGLRLIKRIRLQLMAAMAVANTLGVALVVTCIVWVLPGQPVEVTSDLYGSSVTYRGVVVGLAGGTGSTFAAIPAQNATGNWIKVVQRVPVRIKLDPEQLAARPLQVGLSMEAVIDTREG